MELLIGLLEQKSISIGVIVAVIVAAIVNVEKLLIIKGEIYGLFSKVSTKASKVSLSSKVRGSILKSTNRFDTIEKEILPSDVKVQWIETGEEETFIKNDQVIVRIKKSNNPQENLILATAAFVNEGLLHNHRRYIDPAAIKASKFTMVKKIVQESGRNALTFFEEEYIPKYLTSDKETEEMYNQLKALDKNGMFLHVLLKEYVKAADSIYGDIPDPCLIAESREILRFLYRIATRDSYENTDLRLKINYFKIAIILTASEGVLNKAGIEPYVRKIKEFMKDGYETIYMFGIGYKIKVAEEIAKKINADDSFVCFATQKRYNHTFKNGAKKRAVVYEISSRF